MKRAAVATGIAVVVLAGFAPAASAGERHETQTLRYRGDSERDCRVFSERAGPQINAVSCAAANIAHAATSSGRSRFSAPSWARSVRISIRDDTGRSVGFRVYFNNDTNDDYQFLNSTCTQTATLNLKPHTKRISVARPLASCGAHTTGVVKATFSSRRAMNPSPRHYVVGCMALTVSGIGLGPRCSYTASRAGGYFGVGTWRIEIVRGRGTINLEAVKDPHCSETGFIRPGDFVTVSLAPTIPFVPAGYVMAGDNARCGAPLGG